MDAEHQANADRIRAEGHNLDPEAEAREAIARSWERDGECARLALMDAQAWATLAMVRALRISRRIDYEEAEALARFFHDAYERLAPEFAYQTRKASAVAWEDVPDNNRLLMIATAQEVIAAGWRQPAAG